jgi:hypothetical protein
MKADREPALPKPSPRSVSPSTTRTCSIGTPNTSTTSCASVVAMPWPIWLTAENTSMIPSASTVTVTRSSNTLPLVHSRKVEMPRPRSLPRALLCAARASKPAQSACASPWSMIISNSPESYTCPSGFLYGICPGRTKLRRRSAMRSMPVWRAASSIRRSMMKIASGRPAPR